MSLKHLLAGAGGVLVALLAPTSVAGAPATVAAGPTTAPTASVTAPAATAPTAPATTTTGGPTTAATATVAPTATAATAATAAATGTDTGTATATPATTGTATGTGTGTTATGTATPATTPATVSAQDATFLRAAHRSNLAEIAGGQIAAQKGTTAQVRELGARFVRDHTALDAVVTATAAALGVPLPAAPTPAQQALAERYRTAPPAEFDALFVTTQLKAHHAAMKRGQAELQNGTDPRARQVAAGAAPVIAAHHVALRAALSDLGLGYGSPDR